MNWKFWEKKEILWYSRGYIDFPNNMHQQLAFVMRNGVIVRLDNRELKISIEGNSNSYRNTKLIEVDISGKDV